MKRSLLLILTLLILSVVARPTKRENCQKRFEKGVTAYEAGRVGSAISNLSSVRLNCIGTFEYPDSVYYVLGQSYLNARKAAEARLEFRVITQEFPHSEFREEALYLMGYCSFKAAPIVERESKNINRAMRELNIFLSEYPGSEYRDSAKIYIDSCYAHLVAKEFYSADYYIIVEKYESAIVYYNSIINDYPYSPRIPEAKIKLTESLIGAYRFSEAASMIEELATLDVDAKEIESLESDMIKTKKKQEKEAKRRR